MSISNSQVVKITHFERIKFSFRDVRMIPLNLMWPALSPFVSRWQSWYYTWIWGFVSFLFETVFVVNLLFFGRFTLFFSSSKKKGSLLLLSLVLIRRIRTLPSWSLLFSAPISSAFSLQLKSAFIEKQWLYDQISCGFTLTVTNRPAALLKQLA